MWIGRQWHRAKHRVHGLFNRLAAGRRQDLQLKAREGRTPNDPDRVPGMNSRIIWSTLITAKRKDEVEIARTNLERLKPVLLWSSLSIDGTSTDIGEFIQQDLPAGFDNVVWLTQPHVVSRKGYYAGKMGHFNRISLNFLRGWLCNMEPGEEKAAYLFCHTDGDWTITIRPESIEPICRFFHTHPEVAALSRSLNPGLKEYPNMWPDKETDGAVWFGKSLLSTNVIIAPLERLKPLVLEAFDRFTRHRSDLLEDVLGNLASEKHLVSAYPTREYYKSHFLIDLEETREPFSRDGLD